MRAIAEDPIGLGALDVGPDAIAILCMANNHAFLMVVQDRVVVCGTGEDEPVGRVVVVAGVVVGKRGGSQ